MTIISISRGSYSRGRLIAEKLSERLGYECLNRDVIIEASQEFNIPEVKLMKALHDSPSIFDRFTYGREKYITYIRHAFFHQIKKDNIIYHGLAGHFFLKDIPNVLKVRIIANMEDRIEEEMKRENVSKIEAENFIHKIDEERRKWSQYLYGINTDDASLYDLVVHVDRIDVDQAVDIIADVSKLPCFQSTKDTEKALEERYLTSKTQAALVEQFPTVSVNCCNETFFISCKGSPGSEEKNAQKIKQMLHEIGFNKDAKISVNPIITPD
jgi:cytidylate kinase